MKSNTDEQHEELLDLQLKQAKRKELVEKVRGLIAIGLIAWIFGVLLL